MGVYKTSRGKTPERVVTAKQAKSEQAIAAANAAADAYKRELDKLEVHLVTEHREDVIGNETAVDMAIRLLKTLKGRQEEMVVLPKAEAKVEIPVVKPVEGEIEEATPEPEVLVRPVSAEGTVEEEVDTAAPVGDSDPDGSTDGVDNTEGDQGAEQDNSELLDEERG